MAIDFPNTPALNDEFSAEGRTWIWNGYAWDSVGTVLEEGPVGPQGPQGIQGPPGNLDNLNVSSPITYDLPTSTVGFAGIALDDVTNVNAPTPATGDQLTWNGTAWVNQADPAPTAPAWADITGKPSLIESSLIDAAGDLIIGTADNTAGRLAKGATGSLLKTNGSTVEWIAPGTSGQLLSSTGTDLAWTAPPAAGSMTLLSTNNIDGTDVVISGISTAYKSLYILATDINISAGSNQPLYIRPNSLATDLNYVFVTNTTSWQNDASGVFSWGWLNNTTWASSYSFRIDNYASTDSFKPVLFYGASNNGWGTLGGGAIRNDGAITSLLFRASGFTVTGVIKIYGVN